MTETKTDVVKELGYNKKRSKSERGLKRSTVQSVFKTSKIK